MRGAARVLLRRAYGADARLHGMKPYKEAVEVLKRPQTVPVFAREEESAELLLMRKASVPLLSMSRPLQQNSLSPSLVSKLERGVRQLEEGAVTAMFVLQGGQTTAVHAQPVVRNEADRFFCGGPDLRLLKRMWSEGQREEVVRFYREQGRLVMRLHALRKPWAASMNGMTLGSGAGLAQQALLRFASPETVWAMPETGYGSVPEAGMTKALLALPQRLGIYLALTGRRLLGHDVFFAGLASHMIESADMPLLAEAVAMQNSSHLRYILPVLQDFEYSDPHFQSFSLLPDMEDLERCFGAHSVEQIMERLRECDTPFARRTLQQLQAKSPASLKLTFRAMKEAEEEPYLRQALERECTLMRRLWENEESDLHRGLEAVLQSRTLGSGMPRVEWSEENASDEAIEKMFAPNNDFEGFQWPTIPNRPAQEADDILQYYRALSRLEHAPPLDEESVRYNVEDLPNSMRELTALSAGKNDRLKKFSPEPWSKKTQWVVRVSKEATAGKKPNVRFPDTNKMPAQQDVDVVKELRGMRLMAKVQGTQEEVEVPSHVRNRILVNHADHLDSIEILKVEKLELPQSLRFKTPQEVRQARKQLREHFGIAADMALPHENPSSSNMSGLLMGTGLDVQEEHDELLRSLGEEMRKPEDEEMVHDQLPPIDGRIPEMDYSPLTDREKL